MVLTLCYINFLSYDVTSNLHELKDCISEAEISNERWQAITIQRINSFEGFDAHGFFTLGRPHLTSVVANFITYIIVLIQFKQSEDTESKNKWFRTSKLPISIIVSTTYNCKWHICSVNISIVSYWPFPGICRPCFYLWIPEINKNHCFDSVLWVTTKLERNRGMKFP